MLSNNENAVLDAVGLDEENLSIEDLLSSFEADLELQKSDLSILKEEYDKIGDPDNLGDVVKDVIWEQFVNQVRTSLGAEAADTFIKGNNNLTLDLRKSAHIQTAENFAEGKIATHNTEINYQERYDDWQNNFQRNKDGSIRTKVDYRTGEERAVLRVKDTKKDPSGENYNLNYDAREYIDKGRPKGSKTVNKDHTISAAEIIRDPEAAAHLTRDEQATFANSSVNLIDLDSAANQSKSDSSMTEWLDSERTGKGAGQSQAEYFGVDEQELRERDAKAREEYQKQKQEGHDRSVEAGKKSRRNEAFRVGGQALRAVLRQLLVDLVREIIDKLVKWLKSAQKSLGTFLESLKEAIVTFVGKLKTHLISAGINFFSTVLSTVLGHVLGTIKRVWSLLKQSFQAVADAIAYIRDPANKGKPIGRLMMEVGKIVIAAVTGIGATFLSEAIEAGLRSIPPFGVEIPVIGSLANILGMFLGAVVAGIIGAIVINIIDRRIAKQQKDDNLDSQIEKKNEILNTQGKALDAGVRVTEKAREHAESSMRKTREMAKDMISEAMATVFSEDEEEADTAERLKDTRNNLLELQS